METAKVPLTNKISLTDKLVVPYYNSFALFCNLVWKSISLPSLTPIQNDIAKLLQDPPNNRLILMGFRGVAKSFITCAYVVWNLWRDPQLKIMVVSANKERADANATFIKKIINELPFLNYLKAREGQRDTQNLFDVGPAKPDHSPSVKSVGIRGQLTGSRADIIVADDVEVPSNSFTQVLRDQLFELVKEFDAVLKPGAGKKIIYLGTPQNEMSLYNELQERGYTAVIYPARYPYDDSHRASYGDRLASIIADKYDENPNRWAGKPTDPTRFDEEDLRKRELSYRKAGFALQFMLDTTLSDADKYPLRLRDLLVGMFSLDEAPMKITWLPDPAKRVPVSEAPVMGLKGDSYFYYHTASNEIQKYSYKMMCVDPSGRGKDETGYAVLYYLNGYVFVMEVGGLLGGYSDVVLNKLANVAKKYKVNEVVVEGNWGDGMYLKLFEPVLKKTYPDCGLTEIKSTGQKEVRIIDTLEPVISNHKMVITPECIRNDYSTVPEANYKYACFYQLTRITSDRGALVHDDRLDALAIGVKYLVDFMGVDADEGINELTEEWLEDSLESFYGFVTKDIGGGVKFTDDTKSLGGTSKGGLTRESKGYRIFSNR